MFLLAFAGFRAFSAGIERHREPGALPQAVTLRAFGAADCA